MSHNARFRPVNHSCRIMILAAAACGLMICCAVLLGSGGGSRASNAAQAANAPSVDAAGAVRIGTYDSRAIAVAHARSAAFAQELDTLRRQRAEAVKAGDKKRIAELEAKGESMQVRKHLQGFSTAPVDEVLDSVRDELAGIARQRDLAAITRAVDHHEPMVELVDVTDDLVRLFDPDVQTLKVVAELRKQAPLPIEAAAQMPANP